jgi:Spy/CpxP family protein refolding chaperone
MTKPGWFWLVTCSLIALPCGALAQQPSPYAGQEDRPIKALSDADILAYLNGEGMGYAKAAELNRYPGPRHVLDLAEKLSLTEPQKQRIQKIYDAMHESAATLGKQIVSKEAVLDSLFGERTIDSTHLQALVGDIARLQGQLRAAHLQAHLAVTRILAADQIVAYEKLRGYGGATTGEGHSVH